ncbi:flagellar basal body P-ring formation chaperone FlgA [Candidatus Margulisiibacteriota bacterium]
MIISLKKVRGLVDRIINSFKLFIIFLFVVSFSAVNYAEVTSLEINKEIKTKIAEKIKADFSSLPDKNIKILIKNPTSLSSIPDLAESFKIGINPDANYLGHTVLPILFYGKDNKFLVKNFINIQVQVFTPLIKSAKTIKKDRIVNQEDVIVEVNDFYLKPPNTYCKLEDVLGKQAKFLIGKGTFITDSMIIPKLDILKLNKVTGLYIKDNLQLKIKVIALDGGRAGDTIRVKSLFKNNILEGEVIDSKYVKININ